jgi:hypothetical protein
MNYLLHPKAISLMALSLITVMSYGQAQVQGTVSIPDCQEGANCADARPMTMAAIPAMPLGAAQVGIISTGSAVFGLQEQAEVVKGQPYQAQAVTEVKQTLADGSHIVQTSTATIARDSEGRTVRIQKLKAIGPWKGTSDSSQAQTPTLTSIFDPVAKTHIDYTSDSKIANVITMPPPPPGAVTSGMESGFAIATGGPAGPGSNVMFSVQRHDVAPDALNNRTEQLGNKTIEGIQVTGTRSTDTIPAGTIGNDKDIVVTHETWYSPELKTVVQSTQSDPRFGQTTYSLTNIERSEPDATLFQVPAGYKIEKETPILVKAHHENE